MVNARLSCAPRCRSASWLNGITLTERGSTRARQILRTSFPALPLETILYRMSLCHALAICWHINFHTFPYLSEPTFRLADSTELSLQRSLFRSHFVCR